MSTKLSLERRSARYDALSTAAQMIRDFHTGGFEGDEVSYTDEETQIFLEECQWVADMIDKKAENLIKGYLVVDQS